MAYADRPRETSMFERMNGRSQLLSSNKIITHYFKEWTTTSGVLQKRFCLLFMLQIFPLKSNWSRNLHYPKEN